MPNIFLESGMPPNIGYLHLNFCIIFKFLFYFIVLQYFKFCHKNFYSCSICFYCQFFAFNSCFLNYFYSFTEQENN